MSKAAVFVSKIKELHNIEVSYRSTHILGISSVRSTEVVILSRYMMRSFLSDSISCEVSLKVKTMHVDYTLVPAVFWLLCTLRFILLFTGIKVVTSSSKQVGTGHIEISFNTQLSITIQQYLVDVYIQKNKDTIQCMCSPSHSD